MIASIRFSLKLYNCFLSPFYQWSLHNWYWLTFGDISYFYNKSCYYNPCLLFIARIKLNFFNRRSTSGHTIAYWPLLVLANGGLILVDHVHFQYNGFLFGVLLASVGSMISGHCLRSATLFVILLNLKHIFLYCAPAYFVYLFSSYCFVKTKASPYYSLNNFSFRNLVKLGSIVVIGFSLSFGPFVMEGQLLNVLSRLFPFKRGLTHAYWAPNFWAVYNAFDLVGSRLVSKFLDPKFVPAKTLTGGLVQETEHALLPNVTPLVIQII